MISESKNAIAEKQSLEKQLSYLDSENDQLKK